MLPAGENPGCAIYLAWSIISSTEESFEQQPKSPSQQIYDMNPLELLYLTKTSLNFGINHC